MGAEAGIINEFFVFVLTYEYLGDADESILFALFDKWIELYPRSVTPWEWMASAYAEKGYQERAIECSEAVLRIDPDNPNAGRRIARLRNE